MITMSPSAHEEEHKRLLLAPILSATQPTSGARIGERRLNPNTGTELWWTGTAWQQIGVLRIGTWANRPTSPYTNQLYFASDRSQEFFWNGTRWLTTQIFHSDLTVEPSRPVNTGAVTNTNFAALRAHAGELQLVSGNGGISVDFLMITLFSTQASTATNYYDWTWQYITAAGGVSGGLPIGGSVNTIGQVAGAWKSYMITPIPSTTNILDGTMTHIQISVTIRGTTPINASVYAHGAMGYRIIG